MSVITRFAPSPTGLLHSGNYRTAVFAYLYAKQHQGKFLLRIEDTDSERSRQECEENIIESLTWLGLSWDEIYRQSERTDIYTRHLQKLLDTNKVYISKEDPREPVGREEVIRFRNPHEVVTFKDLIRGGISVDTSDLGDFVIARSLTEPLYHLAVVVDDHEMNISHVIRGEDHISNTPRQILIQRALGFTTPEYAHLPLILGSDRTKLSKRRGARAMMEYRDLGYLPEAIVNYLALLGWHPDGNQEYFSIDELVSAFDLSRVQKGSAIFDETKLLSVNQHWMRALSDDEYLAQFKSRLNLKSDPPIDESRLTLDLAKTVPLLKERARTFDEAKKMLSSELLCLFERPIPRRDTLLAKEPESEPGTAKMALESLLKPIAALDDGVSVDEVRRTVMTIADQIGRGTVLWSLRYALSGQEKSPDPFTLISILGREESLSRMRKAIAII